MVEEEIGVSLPKEEGAPNEHGISPAYDTWALEALRRDWYGK